MVKPSVLLACFFGAFSFSIVMALPSDQDPFCKTWMPARSVGLLEQPMLREASGLEVFDQSFFHINDSGDQGAFYVTDQKTFKTRKIAVTGFTPKDAEDLAIGPCEKEGSCLYIGDIGDNKKKREHLEVVVVPATITPNQTVVAPVKTLRIRYPDQRYNAEAMGITRGGDLIIITKTKKSEKNSKKKSKQQQQTQVAKVFRLSHRQIWEKGTRDHVLEPWGEIDIPSIVGQGGFESLITSMDIAPLGQRFLLLTYGYVIEVKWDFERGPLPRPFPTDSLQVINVTRLPQQEAICYAENGRDFFYDTEVADFAGAEFKSLTAPLMSVSCAN